MRIPIDEVLKRAYDMSIPEKLRFFKSQRVSPPISTQEEEEKEPLAKLKPVFDVLKRLFPEEKYRKMTVGDKILCIKMMGAAQPDTSAAPTQATSS